jgi:metallothionein
MPETIEVKQMKCACANCNCIVSLDKSVKGMDGQAYCSEACAEGHQAAKGCHHAGCNCG